ncbi:MAG: hypothetical protein WCQ21_08645 [Verrucomicrobiota bacterium]
MAGHYAFGEWAWHPRVKLWAESAFWADLPWYALLPPLLWVLWWILSLGRLKIGSLLLKVVAVVCVGDVLWGLVAYNLEALEINLPVQYWPAWTYWMPAVLIVGNLAVLRRLGRASVLASPNILGNLTKSGLATTLALPPSTPAQPSSPLRPHPALPRRTNWLLKAAATSLGCAAVAVTAVHLIPPRLAANGITMELALGFLVLPRLQDDFACLTQQTVWRGKRIGALLDHVELANLQRKQFYPNLDSYTFQAYVLSPSIDRLPLTELDWRRPLWEHFYPRVRNVHDPIAGAQTIVRCLRERVGISPEYPYRVGVETIWTQGMTDATGFERIYVAALRSVGIAAQLGAKAQAEVWTGTAWQPAPRPLSLTKGKGTTDEHRREK